MESGIWNAAHLPHLPYLPYLPHLPCLPHLPFPGLEARIPNSRFRIPNGTLSGTDGRRRHGRVFLDGRRIAACQELVEIGFNRRRVAVAALDLRRQQLADDGGERRRTSRRQRVARRIGGDGVLELTPALTCLQVRVQAMAHHHFVEHDAQRPQIDVRVDASGQQPFGRRIRRRAPVVGGHSRRPRERLGNAEIEDSFLARRREQHVLRLQVGVNDGHVRVAFDRGGKAMRLVEKGAQPGGMFGCRLRRQRASSNLIRELAALDQLHGDVEVAAILAVVVDFRHHAVRAVELLLQDGAVPLGADLIASVGAQHQLERHGAAVAQAASAPHGAELAVIERLAFNRLKISDLPGHAASSLLCGLCQLRGSYSSFKHRIGCAHLPERVARQSFHRFRTGGGHRRDRRIRRRTTFQKHAAADDGARAFRHRDGRAGHFEPGSLQRQATGRQQLNARVHRPGNFNQFDRSALTAYAETDVQRPFGRRFDTNPGDAGAGIADRGDGGGVRHGLGRTPDRDGSGDAGDKIHSVR